jgi:ubiquinone biosynthesis protein
MIFNAGVVHCDLHPGNLMVSGDRLVILDAGLVAHLDPSTRLAFAQFFFAVATGDGAAVATVVLQTAKHVPGDLDRLTFTEEMQVLVASVQRRRAAEFSVARFVTDLFALQKRHRIGGTSQFGLAILALFVYEGVAQRFFPDLDFQGEAVPFVIGALRGGTTPTTTAAPLQ